MPKRVSLVMLDDSPPALYGVVSRLRVQPGLEVLAVSPRVTEALQCARQARPRLAVLNVRPSQARVRLVNAFHQAAPHALLVLMGLAPVHSDLSSLIRARISGFVMADAEFGTLLSTLFLVAGGMKVLPPELLASLFHQLQSNAPRRA